MANKDDRILQLTDVTTGYRFRRGEKVVSRKLNGSLKRGELTCLLGPNGCGKSTLLRSLAGFQPVLEGEIVLGGTLLSHYSGRELSRQVSVVLTHNDGIRNMTAEEVVAMGRHPYTNFWGTLRERDRKVVERCLGWVGATELRRRKIHTLSDGERQKVMLAKAIAQETPVILLDEPTAFLDYPSKISTMLLLHRLAQSLHKTIFLSTHDIEQALQVADQIWLLEGRYGLSTGIPEDLCLQGKIDQYFSHERLIFSPATFTFNIDHDVAQELLVEGGKDSLPYQLLCRALRRNAIAPVPVIAEGQHERMSKDVMVSVLPDGRYGVVDHGKVTFETDKIQHLVEVVKSTIFKNHIENVRHKANMTAYE